MRCAPCMKLKRDLLPQGQAITGRDSLEEILLNGAMDGLTASPPLLEQFWCAIALPLLIYCTCCIDTQLHL